MKTPFYKSPRAHKWGLFCLLAGALAFDISLNPQTQHYGADFASSSETVKVKVDDQTYEFVTSNEDGKPKDAHFVNNGTEADNGLCPSLCGQLIDLKGISNVEDVLKFKVKEAQKTKHEAVASEDKPAPKKVQKAGYATEVDMEEWASKCDSSSTKDSRLECQANRLIALSKYIKDSDEKDSDGSDPEKIILDYYNKYVQPGMSSKYKSSIIKRSSSGYDVDDTAWDDMDTLSSKILAGLRDSNGESTRQAITTMIKKSYSEQIKAGQRMVREGEQTANSAEVYAGMNALNPSFWGSRLDAQMDSLGSSNSDVQDLLNKYLENPVSSMLHQMAASGARAMSQNSQMTKMADGTFSPCIAFCQGYMNFNPDSSGNSYYDPSGTGQIAGSSRNFGRGNSLSNAPWFNNVNIGQNGTVIPGGQYSGGQVIPGGYQNGVQYGNGIGQPQYVGGQMRNGVGINTVPGFNNQSGFTNGVNTGIRQSSVPGRIQ